MRCHNPEHLESEMDEACKSPPPPPLLLAPHSYPSPVFPRLHGIKVPLVSQLAVILRYNYYCTVISV